MDIQEFYNNLKNMHFIKTCEHRYPDGRREPVGRPELVYVDKIYEDSGFMDTLGKDYDQHTAVTTTYPLPQYSDFTCREEGNYCFDIVCHHNGRDLVVRFWEL